MNHKLKIKDLLKGIQKNVPLAPHTTFKIGGPAKYFLTVKTKEDLIEVIKVAKEFDLPFFILGGGSNLLVSDEGYKGMAIKCQMSNVKCQNYNLNLKTIYAEAGVLLEQLVKVALKNSLSGLEWAAGIPGTVGGAIRGNAAAFEKSIQDTVKSIEVLEIQEKKSQISNLKSQKYKLKVKNFSKEDCKFEYKNSIFKRNSNLIILSTMLQLKKGKKKEIGKKIKEYLEYREQNHPLNFPSAGCIFENFTPHRNEVSGARPQIASKFSELKHFERIPAGLLIDKCGLKGKRMGQAQISEKHANFIVNLGNAKAKDVKKLINLIKEKVKEKFGIELEEEIEYLGF